MALAIRRDCGVIIRGNDILDGGDLDFSYYELMTAFRGSRILRTRPVKDGISRHTKSMENAKMIDCAEPDLKYRVDHQVYLRTIDRNMQNECGGETRWGDSDTYDHTRKPIKVAKNNGNGRLNDFGGAFRNNRNKY